MRAKLMCLLRHAITYVVRVKIWKTRSFKERMLMNRLFTTLPLLVALSVTGIVHGGDVSFSYIGQVDQVLMTPVAPFDGVQVGDEIRVDYTLATETPDQDEIADLGTFSGAVVGYEVTIGAASATTVFGGVNTANASIFSESDTYAVVGLYDDFSVTVSFVDDSGVAFGTDVTLSSVNLSDFGEPSFVILNGAFPAVTGNLSIVPEPGANMLVSGMFVVFFAFRRKC